MTSRCVLAAACIQHLMTAICTKSHWDYIVIGAGPGGLQMGYFLQRAHRDYVILEKANESGSFFTRYPRHNKLISINKRHTGSTNREFNMRHDWNSLLSDDESLLIRHFSKEFFPHRNVLVKYLREYQRRLGINVQLNTNISNIRRQRKKGTDNYIFYMDDQKGRVYTCKTLIVATGISIPNNPTFTFSNLTEGYDTMSTDPRDYEGKRVLILGNGNSAFETADALYPYSNVVHIVGRSRVRLSWETHYAGDVRGVNNAILDNYQLKALDGVAEGDLKTLDIKRKDGRLWPGMNGKEYKDNEALRESYDKILRCLGFTFDRSIFNSTCEPDRYEDKLSKFPRIRYNHEVSNIPGMFIAGSAAHSIDYRKSAGGFIHGFRYTVRSLHNMLEWRNHRVQWPAKTLNSDQLLTRMLKRINEAAGIYHMNGVLGDLYNIRRDGDIELMEEIPLDLLHQLELIGGRKLERVMVVVMQYGPNYSGPGKDVFKEGRGETNPGRAHKSNLLHPVIYYYDSPPARADMKTRSSEWILPRPVRIHHMVENILGLWTSPLSHIEPLHKFLASCLDKDLRSFYAFSCFEIALTHKNVPEACRNQYMAGHGITKHQNDLLALKQSFLNRTI